MPVKKDIRSGVEVALSELGGSAFLRTKTAGMPSLPGQTQNLGPLPGVALWAMPDKTPDTDGVTRSAVPSINRSAGMRTLPGEAAAMRTLPGEAQNLGPADLPPFGGIPFILSKRASEV